MRENSSASPRAPGGAYYYARAGDTGFLTASSTSSLDDHPPWPVTCPPRHSAGTRVTRAIIACPRSSTLHRSPACGEP